MADAREFQPEMQRCPVCNGWVNTTPGKPHVAVVVHGQNDYNNRRYFCSTDCVGEYYNDE